MNFHVHLTIAVRIAMRVFGIFTLTERELRSGTIYMHTRISFYEFKL